MEACFPGLTGSMQGKGGEAPLPIQQIHQHVRVGVRLPEHGHGRLG